MSIDTAMARIADIRSTIAAIGGGAPFQPVGSASAAGTSSAAGTDPTDFASRLAALTGASPTTSGGAVAAPSANGGTGGPDRTGGAGGTDRTGGADRTDRTDGPGGTGGAVDGDDVIADAKKYLGVRYVWGGTDPSTGLDCSGLVQRVFADLGQKLPRTVADQKDAGVAVASMKAARPGDLLVFGNHHIGIYVGGGKMLHAPKTGDVVKIARVYDTPTRIRRVLPAGGDGAIVDAASAVRPAALRHASPPAAGTSFDRLFTAATARYDLPAGLLKSVARAESGLDPRARSASGAIGLMQLMPGTARELGVDPTVPAQAVDGAARLLARHLKTFGSVPLALAAYNAGPGAVRKYDGIPPFAETRAYVARVQHLMSGRAS